MAATAAVAAADVASGRRFIAGRWRRWSDEQAQAAYAAGWWSRRTLGEALAESAERTPGRILLVGGERRLDCRTLRDRAMALAGALLARFDPGSVVSFMLPNWHEAAVIYCAASVAGMVVHPILPSMRKSELAFMLADADSRIIFIPAELRGRDFPAMLAGICARLASPPMLVVLRGPAGEHLAYDDLCRERTAERLPVVDPDAASMILYTSGTTGVPKGVMHSQNSIHALVRQLGEHWLIARGDVFLVPSPIAHIGGSIYAFELPLLLGTSAVLMDHWDADAAVALAADHRFTHLAGATPFLEQLLAAARRAGERLHHLKLFVCGGAAVPSALIEAASAQFDRTVVTRVYGSTEVPVVTVGTIDRADVAHAAHTDGRPGVAQTRLGPHPAAGKGEGEILARGPQMLAGYLHAEDEAALFDDDGFYRTGDIGRWVDDDFLLVSGRAKDIIIRNGENISPKEMEDALARHPGIAEVAVIGLPDPRTGERACAVIVPAGAPAPDLPSVLVHLREYGIASFKLPEQVEVWPALPKNATGKVLKHAIRATLLAAKED